MSALRLIAETVSFPIHKKKLNIGWLLLIPLAVWFCFIVSFLSTLILVSKISHTISSQQWNKAVRYSKVLTVTSRASSSLMSISPGSKQLLTAIGYPPSQILRLSNLIPQAILQTGKISVVSPDFSNQLSTLSDTLSLIESELKNILDSSDKPLEPFSSLATTVAESRSLINKINLVSKDVPRLLSLKTQTTYLILLQDNTEIRPSGGFLDTFALVTVDDSRLQNFELFDTSDTDAYLLGDVEPPPSLKEALGESTWYLRDANWDPDFSSTAIQTAWFVQKELSRSVDVVIAVNSQLFKSLLSIVGPVNINQFGGSVSSQNITSQYLHFVKAQDQKPRFLSQLTTAIEPALKSLSPSQSGQLLNLIFTFLQTRQILIYPTTFTSSGLTAAGWSGELKQLDCRSQFTCLSQFIYPVDSNIGINKSSAFVNQITDYNLVFTPRRLISTLTISYTNSSSQSVWPQGSFKNYFRAYLPKDSQLDRVLIKNHPLDPSQYKIGFDSQKPILSFIHNVPPTESVPVEIQFHQPLPSQPRFHYQLEFLNQPGLPPVPFTVTLSYPPEWIVNPGQAFSVASAGHISYNSTLDRPFRLDLDMTPKLQPQ